MAIAAAVMIVFGVSIVLFTLYLVYLISRDHSYAPRLEVVFACGFALLRFSAGIAAIWAGLRWGSAPLLAMLGFFLGAEAWREVMRRVVDAKGVRGGPPASDG